MMAEMERVRQGLVILAMQPRGAEHIDPYGTCYLNRAVWKKREDDN